MTVRTKAHPRRPSALSAPSAVKARPPVRIQLRRAKGWRLPKGAVKVDRSTPWGNPFRVGRDGTVAECMTQFIALLAGCLSVTAEVSFDEQRRYLRHYRQHIETLRGKDLACWCRPGALCHADILLRLANVQTPPPAEFIKWLRNRLKESLAKASKER